MNIRNAGVIIRPDSPDVSRVGQELAAWLGRRRIAVAIDRIEPGMDILIILGGDGTLLHVADRASTLDIPVVGVNLGNLGFLTEVAADEMYKTLEAILDGNARIEHRMMLNASWVSGEGGERSESQFALNEVVLVKDAVERLVQIRCWADQEYITTYKADGLIMATPTGSTAYNLSAGGPVVHAELDAIVVTPICPFMLESRPVLLAPDTRLTAQLMQGSEGVRVIVDGRLKWKIGENDLLLVETAAKPLKLVSSPVKSYFTILRNKLNWGGSSSDLPLPPSAEQFFP